MWQEARKQEKILRGIMVDYKRRAERRKGFYDKIKKDPAEFLQIWGRSVKINIDPNIASAADNPSIMTKWRGDENTLIDRFDVRSHLDTYDEYNNEGSELVLTEAEKNEEKMLNYERYRTLVHNDAFGVTEKDCLKQIELDEKFGCSMPNQEKKAKEPKAQIGYVYQDSTKPTYNSPGQTASATSRTKSPESDLSDENEDDLDFNISIEKLTADNKTILNKCATNYGMECGEYVKFLLMEVEEKEKLKQNKLLEEEKAQYSGRKSRRERRIVKDRLRKERGGELSPLSYIIKNESSRSSSSSSSKSSASSSNARSSKKQTNQNQITFITSFGGENDENETDSVEQLLTSSKQQTESIINNVKRLRQNVARNATSRSRSKSPVSSNKPNSTRLAKANNEKSDSQKNADNDNYNDNRMSSTSSSSAETSDEEKALKKYMKRKEKRKNLQAKSINSITSCNYTNNKATELKEIQQVLTSSATINTDTASLDVVSDKNDEIINKNNLNNSNTNNGNSSTKFRSSGEFKLYQEKLKKKMQKEINKQLKKDKEVEREKQKKEREERREREAELTYLTEKMRQRKAIERRKDRRRQGLASSSSDDTSRSRTSRTRSRSRSRRRRSYSRRSSRTRSRSRSRNRRSSQRYRSRSRSRNNRHRSRSSSRRRSYRARRERTRSRSLKKSYSKSSSSSSRSSSNRRKRNRPSYSSSNSTKSSSSSSSTSTSTSRKNSKKRSVTTSSDSSSD